MAATVTFLPSEPGVVLGAVFDQNASDISQQIELFSRAVEQARTKLKLEAVVLVPQVEPPRVWVRALAARMAPGGAAVSGAQATAQAVRGMLDQLTLGGGATGSSRSNLRLS